MSAILEIKDLYGGYEKDAMILQGISMTIEGGEAVGIIGLNGSGKSTLGKAIMNLLPYRSGELFAKGKPIHMKTTEELSRSGIVLMLQGGAVFPTLSVYDNLQLAFHDNNGNNYATALKKIIPLLDEPVRQQQRTMADRLSGGQRHQLALAMALAQQPWLLILDEPSAGLSPAAVDEMYAMLGQIREEFSISFLLIEQNISRAVSFCDRCLVLNLGQITKSINKDNYKNITEYFMSI